MDLLTRIKGLWKKEKDPPTEKVETATVICYNKDCTGKKDHQGHPVEQKIAVNDVLSEPKIVYCNYCGAPIKVFKSGDTTGFCTPSKEDMSWVSFIQDRMRNTTDALRDLAKYAISLDTLLITTYTAALAYFNVLNNLPSGSIWLLVLALPIISWFVSILVSALVFDARKLHINTSEPGDIKKQLSAYNVDKFIRLQYSLLGLALGILLAIFALYIGISPHSAMVQFVVSENGTSIMENLSIPMVNNTYETVPVELLETMNNSYMLKLSNGQTETFINTAGIINGIIYDNST